MKINIMLKKVFLAIFLSASASAFAHNYEVSAITTIVGMDDVFKIPKVQEGEKAWTLEDVASKYKIGLSNMIEANVGIDPIVPHPEIEVIVPNRTILPNTKREGIVINSPEMRLYYYHDNTVDVLPIGIGDLGTDTPLNWVTKVERKKEGPTWTPTAKMHAEYRARGEYLPAVWPAGPDNPMGLFALYIGRLYAIHGTNADFGIGLRVSHGCVRLRNEDIEYLFHKVPVGTRVEFINKPVKYVKDENGNYFIEVHQPLSKDEAEFETFSNLPFEFTKEDEEFFKNPEIDQEILNKALSERTGRVTWLNPPKF